MLASVVIPLFDRARQRAAGIDLTSAFAGVPMLLKDACEEIADTSTWVGTRGLRRVGHVSKTTTALAERFEELGAVVVGKGACPELSASSTTEPLGFAPTRNPWDASRSVGGSSGGPAAAVAAGFVPIAHGLDRSGSLRFPAALCGVVTLKPRRGRIASAPVAGSPDPLDLWTQFVVARDVRDLIAVFVQLATAPTPTRSSNGVSSRRSRRRFRQSAVAIPSGWTNDGRPVRVQLVGRIGSDEALLDLADDLQPQLRWLDRRPPDR